MENWSWSEILTQKIIPMARAPDTPAILTTPAVGAMSAKEDVEELIKGDTG